jgi:DNA-binding MarR family transcriptional regulator
MIDANSADPDLLKSALATRIFAAYIAGRAAKELEAALSGNAFGLTNTAIPLLHALRQGEKTMAEISRQIPIAPSTLVPLVDALEREGLLQRGRDPRDRRRTPLTLTERGHAALASVPPLAGYAAIFAAMQQMEPGKGHQLADLLRELTASIGGDEIPVIVAEAIRAGMPSSQPPLTKGKGKEEST